MRIQLARGPAVAALQRYDPGLRVRWSHEKGKWAVDAPYGNGPVALPPPVRYERIGDTNQYVEHLMPEYSERYIGFKDRRYVVCFAKTVDWPLFSAIVQRDSHRQSKRAVGLFDKVMREQQEAKARQEQYERSERVYQGWDRFKFDRRKLGPGAEDGTGVSIKGMK